MISLPKCSPLIPHRVVESSVAFLNLSYCIAASLGQQFVFSKHSDSKNFLFSQIWTGDLGIPLGYTTHWPLHVLIATSGHRLSHVTYKLRHFYKSKKLQEHISGTLPKKIWEAKKLGLPFRNICDEVTSIFR